MSRLHPAFFVALVVVVATATPALAAEPLDGRALRRDLQTRVDSVVVVDDIVVASTQPWGEDDREIGFAADSHVKVWLEGAGLLAFLPRSAADLVNGKEARTPLRLTGTVRTSSVPRRDIEVMGENVDITITRGNAVVWYLDVGGVDAGPFRVGRGRSYELVAPTAMATAAVDRDVRVRVEVTGLTFEPTSTATDDALGIRPHNAVKIVGLVPGVVVALQRTPAMLDTLLTLQRGQTVVLDGRLVGDGAWRRLVVDAMRALPPGR